MAAFAGFVGLLWLASRDLGEPEETATTEHDGIAWTFLTDANTPFTSSPAGWGNTVRLPVQRPNITVKH